MCRIERNRVFEFFFQAEASTKQFTIDNSEQSREHQTNQTTGNACKSFRIEMSIGQRSRLARLVLRGFHEANGAEVHQLRREQTHPAAGRDHRCEVQLALARCDAVHDFARGLGDRHHVALLHVKLEWHVAEAARVDVGGNHAGADHANLGFVLGADLRAKRLHKTT